MGWYTNNQRHGNNITLDGNTSQIIESGWYEAGKKIGGMRDHDEYAKFTGG